MLEIYRAIEPYLAALGLTALSASVILGALYAALKWFGEQWVTSKFSERLESFKHAQQREIEQLKFQINASMDRAVKLHQREFETLPQAWSTLVTAYNSVRWLTSSLQTYADVARMRDDELDEFLENSEFSKTEQQNVRESSDRNKAYQNAIYWHRLTKVKKDFQEHHVFLTQNAIFIPPQTKAKFTAIGDIAWDALTEHEVNHEMNDFRQRSKVMKFISVGETMLTELETEIQKRLWSDVTV
jgi:hypothetical protein